MRMAREREKGEGKEEEMRTVSSKLYFISKCLGMLLHFYQVCLNIHERSCIKPKASKYI